MPRPMRYSRRSVTVTKPRPRSLALTVYDIYAYKNNTPTRHEKRRKKKWRSHLQSLIGQKFPHLRLVLAGSSMCGFAVKGSDCDFTLIKNADEDEDAEVPVLPQIKDISESKERNALETEFISTAVVPILILKDSSRGLDRDISYSAANTLYNTLLIRCYGEMDVRVMPLVITIKTWAKNADIMNARDHRLSGFALVLLVLHYLQHGCSPPVLPSLQQKYSSYFKIRDPNRVADWLEQEYTPPIISEYEWANTDTVRDLLKGFFRYYSDFNWRRVVLVRVGGFLPLPMNKKWTNPYIQVEDPSSLTNVTRAVYEELAFERIKEAFKAPCAILKGSRAFASEQDERWACNDR